MTGFGVFFKPRENAAGMTVAVAGTAQGEREEVLAKLLQFPDFVTDLFNVFRHHHVNMAAVVEFVGVKSHERRNVFQTHVEGTAVSDKAQPLQMLVAVDPVVGLSAQRGVNEALRLVKADGFDGKTGLGG